MGDEEKVVEKEGEETGEQEPQGVTLTLEQYDALLGRLEELESKPSGQRDDIDSLAEEGLKKREEEVRLAKEKINWDELSPTELVNKLVDLVRPDFVDLNTKIETVKAMREIDKCEERHDDFWEYKDEIRRIALNNPTLSIEQAYKLAKGDRSEKKEKKEGEPERKKGLLYTLPPRGIPQGERPGVAPGSTKSSEVKTLKAATERAWDEVVGKGKESL